MTQSPGSGFLCENERGNGFDFQGAVKSHGKTNAPAQQLEDEGVEKFNQSFDKLMTH